MNMPPRQLYLPPEYWERYEQGDYIGARHLLELEASKNQDPRLCFLLGQEFGICSRSGFENYEKAFSWFSVAAEYGDPASIHEIGIALLKGLGVERDTESGIQNIKRAAALNDEVALAFLLNPEFHIRYGFHLTEAEEQGMAAHLQKIQNES